MTAVAEAPIFLAPVQQTPAVLSLVTHFPPAMHYVPTMVDRSLAEHLLIKGKLVAPDGTIDPKQLNKRRLEMNLVRKFADDMIDGMWYGTHQALAILPDGGVHDGQHRLLAVVNAYKRNPNQQPIPFVICYNADPASFPGVDHGKSRSAADDFAIDGIENSTPMAQAAKLLYFHLTTLPGHKHNVAESRVPLEPYKWARIQVSSSRLREIVKEHPRLADNIDHTLEVAKGSKLTISSLITSRYIITEAGNESERVHEFYQWLNIGQGLPYLDHPAFTLRQWARDQKSGAGKRWAVANLAKGPLNLRLIVTSWNNSVEGKKISKIAYKTDGKVPKVIVASQELLAA